MHTYLLPLKNLFEAHANAERAALMEAYMRNQFVFYGIMSPVRKALQKQFLAENGLPNPSELETIIRDTWAQPQREYQYFGLELLERGKKHWTADSITLMEALVLKKSWWDTIDFMATHWIGAYFLKFPNQKISTTERWNMDDNFWLQRVSIIFQLQYKEKTDFELLCNYILSRADSTEFFVQKAIGWALREYAKRNPKQVLDFVENTVLMPLSRREALKHF
jgi:3-methyladenine DNA glycosylase AlkD